MKQSCTQTNVKKLFIEKSSFLIIKPSGLCLLIFRVLGPKTPNIISAKALSSY